MWSLITTDSTICWMKTFTDHELKLIRKLTDRPPDTVLEIKEPCPLHSYCSPLPLFRVYKIDDNSFEAEWNEYHRPGVKQGFRFEEVA
jgi:hypothetical protein